MSDFIETTYLSEIIEESNKTAVIIFKYSNSCETSSRLKFELEKALHEKKIGCPIYLVTVQKQKNLSKQIEDFLKIKHESPQVIILNKGNVTYLASHTSIKLTDFLFE